MKSTRAIIFCAAVQVILIVSGGLEAATFTVTNTDASGAGSLQQAMLDANASNGVDTVAFNIAGAGPHTITPTNALPQITDPVIIDGYTQSGASSNTLANGDNAVLKIELTGSYAAGVAGLSFAANNSTVRGLVINQFEVGINLAAQGGNVIEGCFIGTDVPGTNSLGNSMGIDIVSDSNDRIGGTSVGARNLISGNSTGIRIGAFGGTVTNNLIQGNFIGTDVTGTNCLPDSSNCIGNNFIAIEIEGTGGTVIGGTTAGARNIISGNGSLGVLVRGNNNLIQGNFIGTDVTGTKALGNGQSSVNIDNGSGNIIGGLTATPGTPPGNLFAGNFSYILDIFISGTNSNHNLILGNLLGTDVTGTNGLGGGGIAIFSDFGVGSTVSSNTVGGVTTTARNVIASGGVSISGTSGTSISGTGNKVQGNFIGTDITGTRSLIDTAAGVNASGVQILIGGPTATVGSPPGNVISGAGSNTISTVGVLLAGSEIVVQGNIFGMDVTGTVPVPNASHGVQIIGPSDLGSTSSKIGGTNTNERNLIAFNGGSGVIIGSDQFSPFVPTTNNWIVGNSIFSNGGLGIDLLDSGSGGLPGVTPNDDCDPDSFGGNLLQNFPVLTNVTTTVSTTTIQGFLNSASNTTFRLDFYANNECDDLGHGEGETFIGVTNVTTGADCTNRFSVTFAGTIPGCAYVTATASDPNNNTSEFSECLLIGQSGACVAPPSGLISWWPGDGNANDIMDGNTPTITNGTPTFVAAKVGQGMKFGGNDAFTVADNANLNFGAGSFTVDAWVRIDGVPTNDTWLVDKFVGLITSGLGYSLRLGGTDSGTNARRFIFTVGGGNGGGGADEAATAAITDNALHHVTGVHDSANTVTRIYLDGVAQDSFSRSFVSTSTSLVNFQIGQRANPTFTGLFNGVIDELEVFNRALSAAEIQDIVCAGSDGKCKTGACIITCPGNLVVPNTTGQCGATVNYTPPVASGSCPPVVCTPAPGTFFAKGTNTVTCTTNGVTICTFNVIVNDMQNPTIICSSNLVVTAGAGQTNAAVNYATTFGDNCALTFTNCSPPSGSSFPIGTNGVNCTATDTSGNANGCSFAVIVNPSPATQADLRLAKTDAPDPVIVNSNVTYTIVVTNAGPDAATSVVVTDDLPSDTMFVSCTAPNGGVCGGSGNNRTVSYTTVAAGTARTITLVAKVNCGVLTGTIVTNTATIGAAETDPDPGNNSSTTTTTANDPGPSITCPADITVTAGQGQTSAPISYTVTSTDNCPGVTSACTTNGLPVSSTGATFPIGTTAVDCTATDTSAHTAMCSFNVTVNPPTVAMADLLIAKIDAPDPVIINSNLTYTIIVTNAGPDAATSVVVTDNLPAETMFVSCTAPSGGTCGGSGNNRTVTYTSIAAGTARTITLVAKVNCGTLTGTIVTNTATVSAAETDPDPGNNSSTATTAATDPGPTITCPPAIPATAPAGQSNVVVNFSTPTPTDNCPGATAQCTPASGSSFPLGTTPVTCTATDSAGNTSQCTFNVIVTEAPPEPHDFAIINLKAPKTINLKAADPALTKKVKVQIQNRSPHDETIPDLATLANLVTVQVESLGKCPAPVAVLIQGSPNNVPKTIKSKGKLNVQFDVTFTCANDPSKGSPDFRYTAHVNHAALGTGADTHIADDDCPRQPLPGGVDPNPDPDKPLKDKGCAGGEDVTTDVVLKE